MTFQNQQNDCVSVDSDQAGHPSILIRVSFILIRVFFVRSVRY